MEALTRLGAEEKNRLHAAQALPGILRQDPEHNIAFERPARLRLARQAWRMSPCIQFTEKTSA